MTHLLDLRQLAKTFFEDHEACIQTDFVPQESIKWWNLNQSIAQEAKASARGRKG